MRVLVTGGSGVIGAGTIPELLRAGHEVRLLTRHAEDDAREWPDGVQPFTGDITKPRSLRNAARDCGAILHISGIVTESRPHATFERVNVGGTRHILEDAIRAGAPRFVYVSSLGSDRGTSAYHASKRAAEQLVRDYPGSWAIVRPGGVYGPGDEVISRLLTMLRTLPAVPVIGFGNQRFQPIFCEDLGKALVVAAERHDLRGVFELAGPEVTTPAEILAMFAELTGRQPLPIPIPQTIAGLAARIAEATGIPFPIDDAKLRMLLEHNVIEPPSANALTDVFHVSPTPLAKALAWLVDAQPEQLSGEGVGRLERKRFWADIRNPQYEPEALMKVIRQRCTEIMPLEFAGEPGAAQEIVEGASLTASLPVRGNIQVRVVEVEPRHFTFATLRGHPLAGTLRFEAERLPAGAIRFSVTIAARAATMADWLAMKTVGALLQNQNWITLVERVIATSGGTSDTVQVERDLCDGDTASRLENDAADLIMRHKQRDHAR